MKNILVALTTAALIATVGIANAAEKDGKIKSIDSAKMMLTLEDGSQYQLDEGIAVKDLKTGQEVKVMFEIKDGKNMADKIEAK